MSRSRYQFTLGQLVKSVVLCALVLPSLRTPGGAIVLALTGLVALGSLLDRINGGEGLVGGTVSGGLVFGGYGLIGDLRHYLFPDPRFPLVGLLILLPVALVSGLIWGAAVGTALHVIFKKTS